MQQRILGKTGLAVGVIGLGTEHLQTDRDTADDVLASAAEAGANYIDLLYCHPRTRHQAFWEAFGPALTPRRDAFVLAAHWGDPGPGDIAECRQAFSDTLPLLGGYADIAMIDVVEEWGDWVRRSLERLEGFRARGEVGFIGLSTHTPDVALAAAEAGAVQVIMYAIHMLSHYDPAVAPILEACSRHNVGLVAMKPYYGGRILTRNDGAAPVTPVQCLSYVLSRPVTTTVPGPATAEQWRQALAYVTATEAEKQFACVLPRLREAFRGACTYCGHCMPCPLGLQISHVMLCADQGDDVSEDFRSFYEALPVKASACTECGACMERCPFEVDVIAAMRRVVELYE